MKFVILLVFYCTLILTWNGKVTQAVSECPSLDADKLIRLKKLVVKKNVHDQIVGEKQTLWGAKDFFDKDPNTCIKHSSKVVDETTLSQSLEAKGKWFEVPHKRESYLKKVENNVYLEILPNYMNGEDFILAKIYVLYAKNGVIAYFWCIMFVPSPEKKTAHLPSLSGVIGNPNDFNNPKKLYVQKSVNEAVKKILDNKDILGDIKLFKGSC